MKVAIAATFLFFFALGPPALARSSVAKLVPVVRELGDPDSGFKWESRELPVTEDLAGATPRYVVQVRGWIEKENWTLLYENRLLPLKKTPRGREFKLDIELEGPETKVNLYGVRDDGKLENYRYVVQYDEIEEARRETLAYRSKKGSVEPSVALTSFTYLETGVSRFWMLAPTAKLNARYMWSEGRFETRGEFSGTAFPLISASTLPSPILLGANLLAGYALPFVKSLWRLTIFGGPYYRTMIVPQNLYGFSNLFSFEIFPEIKRYLRGGDELSGFIKYIPLNPGLGLFSLTEMELGAGVGWRHRLRNGHPLSVNLEVAALSFYTVSNLILSQSLAVSLGAGYGF